MVPYLYRPLPYPTVGLSFTLTDEETVSPLAE